MQPVLVASKRYLNEADNRTKTSKHKSFFDFRFSVDKSCYMTTTTTTSRLCSCTVVLIYLSLTSIKFLFFICLFSHTQESSFEVCTAHREPHIAIHYIGTDIFGTNTMSEIVSRWMGPAVHQQFRRWRKNRPEKSNYKS